MNAAQRMANSFASRRWFGSDLETHSLTDEVTFYESVVTFHRFSVTSPERKRDEEYQKLMLASRWRFPPVIAVFAMSVVERRIDSRDVELRTPGFRHIPAAMIP